jgi:hypothetical protein
MNGDSRDEYIAAVNNGTPPTAGWLFAQAIFGKPIPNPASAHAETRRQREELERLATISPRHAAELRRQESEEAEARHDRELLEWLAQISPEHASKLRSIERAEAEEREAHEVWQQFYDDSIVQEGRWDPSKHPRGGDPVNRGRWSRTAGSGGVENPSSANPIGDEPAESPFVMAGLKKSKKVAGNVARPAAPRIPPRPTVNDNGIEVAGAGPETTQSYRDKVQKALEILDPRIAAWWKTHG